MTANRISCYAVRGTFKMHTARASWQRPNDIQLLSAEGVFTFCLEEIKDIHFIFLSQEDKAITSNIVEYFRNASINLFRFLHLRLLQKGHSMKTMHYTTIHFYYYFFYDFFSYSSHRTNSTFSDPVCCVHMWWQKMDCSGVDELKTLKIDQNRFMHPKYTLQGNIFASSGRSFVGFQI